MSLNAQDQWTERGDPTAPLIYYSIQLGFILERALGEAPDAPERPHFRALSDVLDVWAREAHRCSEWSAKVIAPDSRSVSATSLLHNVGGLCQEIK